MLNWIGENFQILIGSTFFSGAIFLGVVSFFKSGISTWLNSKVHAHHQKEIEVLKNRLTQESQQISSLRTHLVTRDLQISQKLIERKIIAYEALWKNLQINKQSYLATEVLKSIKIWETDAAVQDSSNVSTMVELLAKFTGVNKLLDDAKLEFEKPAHNRLAKNTEELAVNHKPFIDQNTWDLYSAHQRIMSHATLILVWWKSGASINLLKNDELVEHCKKVLPYQADFLEEYQLGGVFFLTTDLEEKVLGGIRAAFGIDESGVSIKLEPITHPSSTPK